MPWTIAIPGDVPSPLCGGATNRDSSLGGAYNSMICIYGKVIFGAWMWGRCLLLVVIRIHCGASPQPSPELKFTVQLKFRVYFKTFWKFFKWHSAKRFFENKIFICLSCERNVIFWNPFNPSKPGSGYSRRKNCVSTAGFSAIILGQCSSEHDERRLTLALVYMVIDLCVLSRNEKAKFAWKSPASQLAPSGALATGM